MTQTVRIIAPHEGVEKLKQSRFNVVFCFGCLDGSIVGMTKVCCKGSLSGLIFEITTEMSPADAPAESLFLFPKKCSSALFVRWTTAITVPLSLIITGWPKI
jgi:hypothetical protein